MTANNRILFVQCLSIIVTDPINKKKLRNYKKGDRDDLAPLAD